MVCKGDVRRPDSHGGLTQATAKHFQGASWQRCQVHLMRNLLAHAPVKVRADVAQAAKLVLNAPDMAEARRRLAEFSQAFGKSAPKAVAGLEAGFEDAMAVSGPYPRSTANGSEHQYAGTAQRGNPASRAGDPHLPNDESALRLIGALLAEYNENWQERRYLDMDEFAEWAAAAPPPAMATTLLPSPAETIRHPTKTQREFGSKFWT